MGKLQQPIADNTSTETYQIDPALLERAAKDNPDLPLDFIKDILIASQEESTPFEFDEE